MWWKTHFAWQRCLWGLHYKLKLMTPAHRDRFCFLFFNFESSAAENDVITMQPSCSHLNLPVIIALIMLAACRLIVTVLSFDGFFRRKWGSHFTHSHFPPELSSSQSRGCCQSLKMTPISPIWGLHTCTVEYSHICVHVVTHLSTTRDGYTTAPQ